MTKEEDMSVLEWEKDENVAVITMTNGENRQNPVFVKNMLNVLEEIEKDASVSAVIITSSDQKSWSQGLDLDWIMERKKENDLQAIRDFLYGLNNVFKRVLSYPMPVIAAISGHAVAGGAILTCSCDFRFMRSDKGFFFFPEVDISVPFLPGMIALVKRAVPYYKFNEMLLSGKRYFAPEMEEHHIIQKACENEAVLMKEALAFAKTFNKKRGTFGEMKRRLHKEVIEVIDTQDPTFIEPLFIMV
jgi:enoyl-CoA hydratase/carnithine racemase